MRYLSLGALVVILTCCAPTTRITGSWKNTNLVQKNYSTIFVAAITGNTIAKSTTETDIVNALQKIGVSALKSVDEFPPNFKNDSLSKDLILQNVRKKNSDAIMTISLLKKGTESRYVRGSYDYAPASRYAYYGSFWGYYNYWQPATYSPGYYTQEDVYYLETNLYDAASENLIWSAQSETYSFNGLAPVSKEFARIITDKLLADGILQKR